MRAPSALFFLLLAGCASPAAEPAIVDFPDVHGVAIDPLDPTRVYVATHRGLFRGNADGWAQVGEARNDLMGFSIAPDGWTFYASGHPPEGGNLGLVRTTDGGETWAPVGAPGADFHALAVSPADPQRLWGSWRGQILRSDDGGARWLEVSRQPAAALAPHPAQRDVVYAATGRGVARSDDAGVTWTTLSGPPAIGLSAAGNPPALYAGIQGGVETSGDGGATWSRPDFPARDATIAHVFARADGAIVAASYETGVYASADGGETWVVLRAPTR